MNAYHRAAFVASIPFSLLLFSGSVHAQVLPFSIDLEYGMREPEVRQLQDYLRSVGFFHEVATGYFGSITQAGVEAWQDAHCVPATGYFGPLSRAAANGLSGCTASVVDAGFNQRRVILQATAMGDGVASVRYFVDGAPYGPAITAPPYATSGTLTHGIHGFSVRVTYTDGFVITKAPHNINVDVPVDTKGPLIIPILVQSGGPFIAPGIPR